MKHILTGICMLATGPAFAHEISAAHIHGAGGAIYPIGALAALVALGALLTYVARKIRR